MRSRNVYIYIYMLEHKLTLIKHSCEKNSASLSEALYQDDIVVKCGIYILAISIAVYRHFTPTEASTQSWFEVAVQGE